MSIYYNPKRIRNLFDPSSGVPYVLSRSKIDSFLNCPRCFYLDRRLGISQPPGFPMSLNSAVDRLLKKEFDIYRASGESHPLLLSHNIDAQPMQHEKIDEWRDALGGGVRHHDLQTNFIITGAVDDIWVNPKGELHVVDYKATSKDSEVTLDADWQIAYKRQMEFYQWLLRKNGFSVSDVGYFVYCNGDAGRDRMDGVLNFNIKILPYTGNDAWVEKTLRDARECLLGDTLPQSHENCDFCRYREEVQKIKK